MGSRQFADRNADKKLTNDINAGDKNG